MVFNAVVAACVTAMSPLNTSSIVMRPMAPYEMWPVVVIVVGPDGRSNDDNALRIETKANSGVRLSSCNTWKLNVRGAAPAEWRFTRTASSAGPRPRTPPTPTDRSCVMRPMTGPISPIFIEASRLGSTVSTRACVIGIVVGP